MSSTLIIDLIFDVLLEIAVFMVSLRLFVGGYHAITPLRCYVFSVIVLIVVSIGVKCVYIPDLVCYIVLITSAIVVLFLSPVEDKNKPLDKIEQKIYKRRAAFIAITELITAIAFKLMEADGLFVAVLYSFIILNIMLLLGTAKNYLNLAP